MIIMTVGEMKKFLEDKNDEDHVYAKTSFDKFNITELADKGADGYEYQGFVILKIEVM